MNNREYYSKFDFPVVTASSETLAIIYNLLTICLFVKDFSSFKKVRYRWDEVLFVSNLQSKLKKLSKWITLMKRYRPLVNLILRAVCSYEADLPPVTKNEIGKTLILLTWDNDYRAFDTFYLKQLRNKLRILPPSS